MNLSVDLEQEEDGRWIGEVPELPGVLAYGKSREKAVAFAKALAFRVLADRLEHGEESARTRRSAWFKKRGKRVTSGDAYAAGMLEYRL